MSWISFALGVVQRAPRPADDRSHEHGAGVMDEQPPRPDGQPRLDVAASEDLPQLDRRACGANDVVLVRPVRAERRDQLHARLRRERAAVPGDDVRDGPAYVLEHRAGSLELELVVEERLDEQ